MLRTQAGGEEAPRSVFDEASPPPQAGGGTGTGAGAAGLGAGGQAIIDFVRDAPPAEAVCAPGTGLPRLLAASPLIIGTPATGPGPADETVAMLLGGVLPPGTPARNGLATLAAIQLLMPDKRLFLCALNSISAPQVIGHGLLAASDDVETHGADSRSARDLAAVKAGTPIVCFNLHTRVLHGLFLARGPCVRDLVPALVPRMGHKTFPVQIPVVCIADTAPLPEAAVSAVRAVPNHIGFFPPRESHDIIGQLLSSLPLPTQFETVALLRQMNLTGCFPFLTAADGAPAPIDPMGRPISVAAARAALAAAGPDSLPPVVPQAAPSAPEPAPPLASARKRERDA